MGRTSGLEQIVAAQRSWAARAGLNTDGVGQLQSVAANLFPDLSEQTEAEFSDGAGSELLGSMRSLRSSSALVVNVFEPWRFATQPAGALFDRPDLDSLTFEAAYPTGLRGTSPHLDVFLSGGESLPIAIESKFSETYSPAKNGFSRAYF